MIAGMVVTVLSVWWCVLLLQTAMSTDRVLRRVRYHVSRFRQVVTSQLQITNNIR